jgi:uncharacterized damage-inducible protein DinB
MPDFDLTRAFLDFSRAKLLDEYWPRMRTSVESLSEDQVWWRPNESSNSIGNLLLHLNGNVTQWLLVSFSREDDRRQRSAEFAQRDPLAKRELLDRLGATLGQVGEVLARLTTDDLAAPMQIQGYQVTGFDAIYHVVEHFGLHYGQIVYITKMLTARDLGFYRQLDATGRA